MSVYITSNIDIEDLFDSKTTSIKIGAFEKIVEDAVAELTDVKRYLPDNNIDNEKLTTEISILLNEHWQQAKGNSVGFSAGDLIPKIDDTAKVTSKFVPIKRLKGSIVGVESHVCHSIVEDKDGTTFLYDFAIESLPPLQRNNVSLGAPVNVLIGNEFEGKTLVQKVKVSLFNADNPTKQKLGPNIIKSITEKWSF